MKIFHTSDWHLGVSLEHTPRHEEHKRFLEWLLSELDEKEIDVLLISGDIFHYTQPSASAQRDLFSFFAKCSTIESLHHIVLIAGNHDSPTRLDAPKEILTSLNIHVVGELEKREDALIPLTGKTGKVGAFLVAVPYLIESKLGVSTTKKKPAEIKKNFVDSFTNLYADLLEKGKQTYGNIPAIAMGHLTCSTPDIPFNEGDFQTPIHQFQTIHGLPPEIFEGYTYTALGHIHRQHRVGNNPVWYSGSPVPISVVESRSPRFILEVEIDGSKPVVTPRRVPCWRDVFELVGYESEIIDLLQSLTWSSELAPYLYMERLVDQPTQAGVDRFQSFLEREFPEPRPRIVAFKKTLTDIIVQPEVQDRPQLESLSPEDVFELMFKEKFEKSPSDEHLIAFRSLLSELESNP